MVVFIFDNIRHLATGYYEIGFGKSFFFITANKSAKSNCYWQNYPDRFIHEYGAYDFYWLKEKH
jgi:hypothetical protein